MRIKRVNRYYCDFCGRGGCAAGHMKKHEKHCTLNPNRSCGFCKQHGDETSTNIPSVISLFPNPKKYEIANEWDGFDYRGDLTTDANIALKLARDATENCPACILAALRQAKIPIPMVTDFNYKSEVIAFWTERNQDLQREDYV